MKKFMKESKLVTVVLSVFLLFLVGVVYAEHIHTSHEFFHVEEIVCIPTGECESPYENAHWDFDSTEDNVVSLGQGFENEDRFWCLIEDCYDQHGGAVDENSFLVEISYAEAYKGYGEEDYNEAIEELVEADASLYNAGLECNIGNHVTSLANIELARSHQESARACLDLGWIEMAFEHTSLANAYEELVRENGGNQCGCDFAEWVQ